MKKIKNLGIFMDHASAHFLILDDQKINTKTIDSKFTHQAKIDALSKGENLMHEKEHHLQAQYFKEIADVIKDYSHVLIFGPTDAKTELANTLKNDRHFDKINIEIKATDKMEPGHQEIFVRNYFSQYAPIKG